MSDTLLQEVGALVGAIAGAMGLGVTVELEMTADGPRVDLQGEDGSLLLKHNGEALQALQHVASAVFRDRLDGRQRVAVDCLGFRRDKDAELRQMARFLAEKARRTGAEQKLGPLNPYERRIVHMVVAEEEGVASESIGDAFMKTVLIAVRD